MTTALLEKARAGDDAAFQELIDPFRRELHVHCYRMLGSYQDAEDVLQETLLAAWRGLAGYEGRSSLRTWLYRIATNSCLNARRAASRQPAKEWDVPNVQPPDPTRLGEVPWLEPYPDVALDGLSIPLGPEARYEQSESMSLAFVTALQALPPRQVAVLILRDVLGFPAQDVAEMLDTTVSAANSALKRARATLAERPADPAPVSTPADQDLIDRFVKAYSRLTSKRSSLCSPTTSSSRCRRCRSSTKGPTPWPASAPPSSAAAGDPRPGADGRQRPAGVRRLPARAGRGEPRQRPHRADSPGGQDLRHDPLRERRAAALRAAPLPAVRVEVASHTALRKILQRRFLQRTSERCCRNAAQVTRS